MDIGRTIAASLATAALGLSAACGTDDTGSDPPEPSTQSDSQSSAAAPVNMKQCLRRQAYHTWPARDRLQNITEGVLAEPDRVPTEAIRKFARNISTAVEETSKACGDEATALHTLAELVEPTTGTGIDEELLRQIVDAFEEWGTTIGRPRETMAPVPASDPEPSPIHVFPDGDVCVFDVFGRPTRASARVASLSSPPSEQAPDGRPR